MPENYSSGFRGFITLRDALRFSVNTVSIVVAREVGLGNVIPTIARELYVTPQQIPYNLRSRLAVMKFHRSVWPGVFLISRAAARASNPCC